MKLFPHQEKEIDETKELNKVAYYHDMGLGKTYTGAEKMMQLGEEWNIIICQKSKVDDWKMHFFQNYIDKTKCDESGAWCYDITTANGMDMFLHSRYRIKIGIINYELAFRRPELLKLKNFTLMLDESSMIQNETAKRTKFIMKLNYENLILLSGTPCAGKYEKLWSQLHMLGWNISKDLYWKQYVDVKIIDNQGFPIKVVKGYKNVERLKEKMREYGCRFLKTEDVFDLPEQIYNEVKVDTTKEYNKFKKSRIIVIDDKELVGDTTLTKMLYERQLCGAYNSNKLEALKDLLQSSDDRIIIFYNFNDELKAIEDLCIKLDKPISIVNGQEKDLSCYEEYENSVTLIQYQAGAMGLNLQKSNKIIYFTPPLSSELFEQSKKRTHRLKQERPCFYYLLICRNSIEERIYETLEKRRDFTDELFREMENN